MKVHRYIIIFATAASAATSLPVSAQTERDRSGALIDQIRVEAAWHGVEVERIRREDQALRVIGRDRRGLLVTMTMDCARLGYVCRSKDDGTGLVASRIADVGREAGPTAVAE